MAATTKQVPKKKPKHRATAEYISTGIAIRKLREDLGMTQAAFSEKVGIAHPGMSSLETGKRALTLRMHERIAKALGMSVGELDRKLNSTSKSTNDKPVRAPQRSESYELAVIREPREKELGSIDIVFVTSNSIGVRLLVSGDNDLVSKDEIVAAAQELIGRVGPSLL